MILKLGSRLRSTVCETDVVVVRTSGEDVDLRCGGRPMVGVDEPVPPAVVAAPDPEHADGTLLGKRYQDTDGRFELLCTRAGQGSLSVGGAALVRKDAKPLPASD